uniref:ABC-type xenobiotic transporter n=1 Tax=Enterobius vermicularis TaxID=51028 RepID=A0A0N4V6C8_ENTVE
LILKIWHFKFTLVSAIKSSVCREDGTVIIDACRTANAEKLINQLPEKYNTLVGDRGVQLSGGQKQRIAIARAIVRNSKSFLLDEATSALDAESENLVRKALNKAAKNRTTLVIAHWLSSVKNADKILVVKDGSIVEAGTHQTLIAKCGYCHDLVNAQIISDLEGNGSQTTSSPLDRQLSVGSSASLQPSDTCEEELRCSSQPFKSFKNDVTVNSDNENEVERLKKDLKEEGAKESDLCAILKYSLPEWGFITFALIIYAIQGCGFPSFAFLFSVILNMFSKPKEEMKNEGHFWALMFLVLGGSMALCVSSQAISFGYAAEKLTRRLRYILFRNILSMDVAIFDMPKHSSGKILARLAMGAPNVKSAVDYRLGSVITSLVTTACGISIAFAYSWQLASLIVALVPFAGFAHYLHIRFMEGRHRKSSKEVETSGKGLCFGLSHSAFFFIYTFSFRLGLYFISTGVLGRMQVLRVTYAINFTTGGRGFISAYFPEYVKAKLSAGIIFKMLREDSKINGLSLQGVRLEVNDKISTNNLRFAYPERPTVGVLKGLSLEVDIGKKLAIVGASGCGKSTVVSILERFYDFSCGKVLLDGYNVRDFNPQYLRSCFAVVSQEPILFDCTIKENIVYGLMRRTVDDNKIFEVAQQANIHDFIVSLPAGYETKVGEKGVQLSGGQKQRIAIARTLIRDPKILLLDEATSALDAESETVVQEALNRAVQGRTCVIIAHRLSTVISADCIVVMGRGSILEQGWCYFLGHYIIFSLVIGYKLVL